MPPKASPSSWYPVPGVRDQDPLALRLRPARRAEVQRRLAQADGRPRRDCALVPDREIAAWLPAGGAEAPPRVNVSRPKPRWLRTVEFMPVSEPRTGPSRSISRYDSRKSSPAADEIATRVEDYPYPKPPAQKPSLFTPEPSAVQAVPSHFATRFAVTPAGRRECASGVKIPRPNRQAVTTVIHPRGRAPTRPSRPISRFDSPKSPPAVVKTPPRRGPCPKPPDA